MTYRRSALALMTTAGLALLLTGCQALHQAEVQTTEPHDAKRKQGIHLQLHDETHASSDAEGITLVSANETLHKAIRAAYPDAPILADSGIRLDQRLNVWAEGLTPSRYLDYLGSQVDAEITYNDRGEIEVRSTSQWAFTLPREEAEHLMPQAVQLAHQASLTAMVLGEDQHILVLSGSPGDLDRLRRALNQVSDRITLERNLQQRGD